MSPRWLGQLALAGVALVSGTYVFVYLVRWEWDRAMVSAMVFLAAEVLLVTTFLSTRLHRIERRLDADPRRLARLSAAQQPPRITFDWLDPTKGHTNVLVPVLMGAGVVLGGVAFAVERVARATAAPVAERGLARRLAPLSLPPGGLLPPPGPAVPPAPPPARHPVRAALVALMVLTALATGLVALADHLQTRPDQNVPAGSVIELTVESRRVLTDVVPLTAMLWSACELQAPAGTEVAIDRVPGTQARAFIRLEPGLGTFSSRRLRGCLADLRVDRVRVSDVQVVHTGG